MSAAPAGPVVRFGRLERRGVLLGLSAPQLGAVGVAAGIAVTAVYTAGTSGLLVSSPLWGVLLLVGTVTIAGRPVIAWVPLVAVWQARRRSGLTRTPAITRVAADPAVLRLPGLVAPFELLHAPELGAVLLADRRAGTVTGVLRVAGSGFVLDEPGLQEHKVTGWGRTLATICQDPAIVRVQLLARTVPGGIAPTRRWWREHASTSGNAVVAALAGMLDDGFTAPARRETLVAVAVRSGGARRRESIVVDRVVPHLQAVAASLGSGELAACGWLNAADLGAALRGAYEPEAAARAEDAPASLGGPVGAAERWASVTTGTAVHATYWVNEWPRTTVHPAFLQPLLLADAATFTVLAEPLPVAKALREIRHAKVEQVADAATRSRIGQIEDEATRAEVADLEQREAELVAGHGDLRFTGLLTVTAPDEVSLEDRCTAVETAAAQSTLELRRLVGQQGVAFLAAALPLARGVL